MEDYCGAYELDLSTRKLTAPPDAGVIAVARDVSVRDVRFAFPRWYHGVDLGAMQWRVLYVNGLNDEGIDPVEEIGGDENTVELTWRPSAHFTANAGEKVQFSLCGISYAEDGVTVAREFHSLPCDTDIPGTLSEDAEEVVVERLDWIWKVVSDCEAATDAANAAAGSIDARLDEACAAAEAEIAAAEEDRVLAELARDDAEALRTARFADMEQRSRGWLRYICRDGEYDPESGRPTVESPDAGTMYFVPSAVGTEQSAYQEWIWVSEDARWESFGEVELSITPVSPEQLTAVTDGTDGGEGGSEVMTLTGWRLAWSLIKGAFAAIAHKHSASDITSGTFGAERIASGAVGVSQLASNAVTTAKIADNQVTSAKLDSTLRDSISRTGGKTSNYWWGRMGNVVVVAGFCVSTEAKTFTLGTLPAGCRPPSYTAAPTASGGYAEVGSDGVVKVVAKASGANYFTLCYPIA